MKKPFDRMVGPKGVWTDDAEVVGESGLTAREDFALRCLNAAANLYGVLTIDEFVSLYNGYAKDHEPAVARPMTTDELERLADRLIDFCEAEDEEEPDSFDDIVNRTECWFDVFDYKQTGQRLIVQSQFADVLPDGVPDTLEDWEEDVRKCAEKQISQTVAKFVKVELKILPEDEFLEYEEPTYSEETEETKKFEEFLVDEYGLDGDSAGFDLWGIQGEIRCNGATATNALEYIRDQCDWEPVDYDGVERLVRAVSPVVSVTRTWEYRGHTEAEMCQLGLLPNESREDIPDVFGLADDEDEYDDGEDFIRLDDLPKPVYNGPIDFKFVKDTVRREAKMSVYDDVRQILDEFASKYLANESTPERMSDAAVRQLAKRKDEMDGYDRLALEYFSSARYTWLLIEAVKAGCGMKCRDLMTGEELFLVERSGSVGDIKGRTLCAGIVPMEDVYISTGTGSLVYLRDPEAELGKVLSQMGLLNERPMLLSFHDQARFVEATVHRLQAIRNRA